MQGLSKTGSDLPEALVLEILLKLPVKSLTRFRCVCKPWSSSFQTPLFITKHLQNNLRNNNLNLFHKGFCGDTRDGIHSFSQLSTEKGQSFSMMVVIRLPFGTPLPESLKYSLNPQQRPPLVDSTSLIALATGSFGDLILSFDMVNEKFSTLPLPQTLDGFYSHLLDFNGLLGAIFYPGEGIGKSFDLWVMNESWTKQFNIESIPGVEMLLGFWKNGEFFIESSDHELVLFDPST
ncbi:hypothetical protein V6N11_046064 [Hibiscus sabdariffa]|uniref:F-box domain-containing protein n=1 Tax=Hibiscus sabdariffa TaxID=183260 RepID=A0ABR1ZDV0_9ROSI